MKKALLTLTLITICIRLYSQTVPFEAGYYIKGGDTVRGFIKRQDEFKLSIAVTFAESLTSNEIKFLPSDIEGFGFDTDGVCFTAIDTELRKQDESKIAKMFGKNMLTGSVSLYKVQVPEEERFVRFEKGNTFVYVLKKGEQFFTLGRYEYIRIGQKPLDLSKKEYHTFYQKYKIDLENKIFNDCPAVAGKVKQLEFKDRFIVDIVKDYATCKYPESGLTAHTFKIPASRKVGLEIGYSIPQLRYRVGSGSGFKLGLFHEQGQPNLSRYASFRTGFNYLSFKYEENDLSREFSLIQIPLYQQFTFGKNVKLFTVVGLSPVFLLKEEGNLPALLSNEFVLQRITVFTHIEVGVSFNRFKLYTGMDSYQFSIKSSKLFSINLGFILFDSQRRN